MSVDDDSEITINDAIELPNNVYQ